MSLPSRFLASLAQVMAAMGLYDEGHPALERAVDRAYGRLVDLQEEEEVRFFNFVGGDILEGEVPLRELRGWDWGPRLVQAGIQRLELLDRVSRDDFEAFLDEIHPKVVGAPVSSAQVRQGRPSSIRYGQLGMHGRQDRLEDEARTMATATMAYSLAEEMEGVAWLHQEVKDGRGLQLLEVEGVVRSLSVAMHGDQAFLLPMLRLKEYDQYTVTHSLNVAVLTMSLAEFLGLTPREVRAFGIAGLLHDLGKVAIPDDILNKPGKLTAAERDLLQSHTVEGARLILEAEEHLDMAAIVAYEHHMCIDGSGYPHFHYPRACHQASNLVHVCDVFDALRTDRPYRDAWPMDQALEIIEAGAGPEFDRDVAHAFLGMMERWGDRIAQVSPEDPVVRTEPEEVVLDLDDDEEALDLDEIQELFGDDPSEWTDG